MTDKKTRSRRFLVVGHKSGKWIDTYVKAGNYAGARAIAVDQFNTAGFDFQGADDANLYAVNLPE